MRKEKELVKNTAILAIGTLSSKIFTFLLLPLYTSLLTTEDFGTIDVLQTFVSLLVPTVTLQISSGVFRFVIEYNNLSKRKSLISSGFISTLILTFIFSGLIYAFSFIINIPHLFIFILCFVTTALSELVMNTYRGLSKNYLYSLGSFIVTLTSLVTNIVLILGFGFGGESILIAICVSNIIGILVVTIVGKFWVYISVSQFSFYELKDILRYTLPLIPNAVSWWIVNTSNRLVNFYFLGGAENGIFAAASKIPTIYLTFFNVYNMAWTELVSRYIDDDDSEDFMNRLLNKSFKLLISLTLVIVSLLRFFFPFIIGEEFRSSYNHIPILLIAIFINSLCSLYGGIFTAFKKTKTIGNTTVIGAVVNIVVNLALINFIGLFAASISTLIAYSTIYYFRRRELSKIINFKLRIPFQMILITILVIIDYYLIKNLVLNILVFIILLISTYVSNKEMINSGFISLKTKMGRKKK